MGYLLEWKKAVGFGIFSDKIDCEYLVDKAEYPYFCCPERERYSCLAQLVRASDC